LSTLAVLEHRDGKVSTGSLPAVTAASKLGGPVTAFVAGTDAKSIAEQAAKLQGVDKVIFVANGAYDRVGSFSSPCLQSLTFFVYRVYQRPLHHYYQRTSAKATSHMSSAHTPPSARM
jgi:electron transfer flavoprotein alpha subunit